MKLILSLAFAFWAILSESSECDKSLPDATAVDQSRWVAHAQGAKAKECFLVIDIEGRPVEDAEVRCTFWMGGGASGWQSIRGCTDANGLCSIEGVSKANVEYLVAKDGYYRSHGKVDYMETRSVPAVIDGKWQPYGETRTVVLKRIVDPHMVKVFGEKSYRHHIPVWEKWIGYDLEVNEWVPPYGAGKFSDVLLRFKADVRQRNRYFTYVIDVSFTNNPCAGAYLMKKDADSDLKSVHYANTNGVFDAKLTFSSESKPGVPVRLNYLDSNSYLVFRTRTQVDDKGNLLRAHYGKIYGSWRSNDEEMLISGGCFNPVENDTNIEGDQVLLYKIRNYKVAK